MIIRENSFVNNKESSGFALISSLFVMILLVMVAFAMLSLSSVEQRSSQDGRAMAEAQANARMALMVAIGELQEQMGPDQRISANAGILPPSIDGDGDPVPIANPHYMGVWDSWIAGTVDPTTVNPDYPSAASHHQTIGTSADDLMLLEMHPD
jgi:type II secretory pathway pseudopilin PulG